MLNKVILIGKIAVEPEIKYFKNNNAITVLKLVTTESSGNKQDNDWHRIIINNVNKYLKKNMLIFIIGKIKTRRWLNLKNEYNYITEIFADEIKIINYDYKKNNDYNVNISEDLASVDKKEIEKKLEDNEFENNKEEIYEKDEDYKYNYSTSEESV
ncbi:single-stranded DNA-binding protein [Candidatus Nasuia deltocephalinicola]|uniref:single-stranded DNA-binding protein n=1 Tax=Candidatus Nasuia deltocephalincola TaxID=1160784 RepID=UPI00216B5767|nr:single-stranded DNA-binding protein [Candidatus Nasuia deltocephalinicola]